MPHTIAVKASVLALFLRPDVGAFTFTHVVFEQSSEVALVLIILNGSLAVQSAVFIPRTIVSAAYSATHDLDYARTNKLAQARLVVRRC